MNSSQPIDIAVVGAGAAGILAAIYAARGGARVTILDATAKAGRKILISGGGRCNVLPAEFRAEAFYSSGSANVLRRLFKTWPLTEVRDFFENELAVELVLEEESGKLFPKANRAIVIYQALMTALQEEGVEIIKEWPVAEIVSHTDGTFSLANDDGQLLEAKRVILAAGGMSVPKTGSNGSGYHLAKSLGHELIQPYPALVPLLTEPSIWTELSGLAQFVEWTATSNQKRLASGEGNFLFTHFGYSGPAALNCSHWFARQGCKIHVAWNAWDAEAWQELLTRAGNTTLTAVLSPHLPKRFVKTLLQYCELAFDQNTSQLRKADRQRLLTALSNFELPIIGTRGFDYAEVTGGGIDLKQVDPSTLQSRRQPGLYFCGEILDVIGEIGGHNFLWAWVSGKLAGSQAARDLRPE
jgi:predicted Rossmann fold flavoprotein